MMKQYESAKRPRIQNSRQLTSAASKHVDSSYIISQMKQLLKENTALKQENLILKQQIMLSKIQIQNLQLKLEQTLTDSHQAIILSMTNTQETKKDLSKKHVGRHSKFKSELVRHSFVQNQPKQREQNTGKMFRRQALKQISQYSTVSNTTGKSLVQERKVQCLSSRGTTVKRDQQLQLPKKSIKIEREGKSLSKKQQIIKKYRPFLDIDGPFLTQRIEIARTHL